MKQDASYTLTVTDTVSGNVLEEGVHYTQQITSENGTGADGNPTSDGSQLGTVTVTITGIPENGYAGTREVTFKVTPAVRVTLEDGTETEYLKISEAFASVHEGQTATITLFHDVEVESGKSITVSGTIELVGGDYTISGTRSYYRKGSATGLFHISSGASLTVQSGTIRNVVSVDNAYNSSYCITVDGGALTVNGGSIMALHEGSQMTMGIYATGGTVEIHGGSVYAEDLSPDIWGVGYGIAVYGGTIVISEGRIEGNACGLYVAEGTASLSGGTFAGLDSRVYALDSSVGAVGTLLVNGYVYYDGEEAEGTPAYGVNSTETYLPAGPFTVGLCMEHNYGDCSDTGTGVHTYVCGYCGKENAESHNWGGWSNDEASGKHIHICTDCGATENGDHNWDSSGNCTDCTAQAPVSVSRDGGRTANYYSSIEEAWAAAKELSNGDTQTTLTLLQNVTVSATLTVESGDDIILTSAEGTEYSLSGDVYNRESGLINVSGGTFMLQGGIIENGENGTNAVAVNGGLFILDGGTAVARASGESGVCVYNGGAADLRSGSASGYNGAAIVDGGSATISGGTYTGTSAAILLRNVDSTLKSILEQDMAYYSGSDIIAENLITDLTGRSLTGTVTVGKCEHSYSVWTANEDGKTHSGTCVVCGDSISADHSWGENGKCTAEGCTAQAVASVTVNDGKSAYYPTIEEAWQAAKNMTGTATVTLLADAVVTSSLTVEDSEEIIFTGKSADGVVHTLSSDMLGYQGVIAVNGGSLILLDGNIKPCSMGYGLNVKGGSFIMQDGSIVGSYWALVAEAGSVTIEGGTIDAGRGYGLMVYKDAPVTVTLSGGTYIGGSGGNYAVGGSGSVGAYLANGYAYKQGDTWVNDTTVTELTGTVTVEEAPLQNVSISPATTTITYGDTAPTLTATAVQPEGSTNNVTYQWYLDGEEIAGTTGETYTPDKLDVGEYSYTCTATVDGYSLPGTVAIVTVNRASIENATVTLTGTSFEYLGGTLEIGVQSVMLNGVKLTWGTDYIYSGSTGEAAKTYTVTVEGKGNYTGTATAEWEIYPRELTVGGWMIEKVYDGTADIALDSTEFQLDFGYPWYGQDDDVKLDASGVTAQFSDAAAGEEKVITYTGEFTLTGGDADNYILKKQPAFLTGTITQRKITVTPDEGQKRGYGQAMPVLTYTITGDGMAEGESLTGALACDTGDGAVGKYEITQGTLTATENYDLTFTDGVMFEITAVEDVISVDVTWGAMEFTYTDGAWNPETHTYGDGGWTATDDRDQITVTNKGNTNVTVSYLYVQTNEEVFGSFMEMGEDGESRKLLDTSNPIALPAGETKTTWLSLLGHPGDNFIGTHELGTVTVTIGSGTTKNDPIGGGE
ncbi:MAG: YDG domain-containing protein [bacterium]|nr:YDG domain-containing protein [bacterium]